MLRAGLTEDGGRLALYVHSPDTVKQLLLPPSFLRRFPSIDIRTDLTDMQVGWGCAWPRSGVGVGGGTGGERDGRRG